MTVKQVWEYGKDRGFDWYSQITSVVEYQNDTDSMFVYSATARLGKMLQKIGKTEPIINEIAKSRLRDEIYKYGSNHRL